MKKNAILYIRVSTDEQAEKGYSLLDQRDKLIRFCQKNNVEIAAIYQEDFSAKTFERPEWRKVLDFAKKSKGQVNHLYIVDWSRFSRNVADAFMMIEVLKRMTIEVQAIDQPLDFAVPESLIMLSIYLSTPQVENMRRSMRVKSGMQRAKLDGRVMGTAPRGYKNVRNERGIASIVPSIDAQLVKEAFITLANGTSNQQEIRRSLNQKGIDIGKSQFNYLIRNPIYCGLVSIIEEGGAKRLIKAQHEGLISHELFDNVQQMLDGKRINPLKYNTIVEELPLRGFLRCPRCGKNMTGSASRGKLGGRFFYYHCSLGCPERQKAKVVNDEFVSLLSQIQFKSGVLDLYYDVVEKVFKESQKTDNTELHKKDDEIKKNKERINQAQLLLLDNKLDAQDYREIKTKYEEINMGIQLEKNNIQSVDANFMDYLKFNVQFIKNIDQVYLKSDTSIKQKIVGSILNEKFIFENLEYRTPNFCQIISLIMNKDNKIESIKKGLKGKISKQSNQVASAGIEPASKV